MPVYNPKRLTRVETLRAIHPRSLVELLRRHRAFFAAQGYPLPTRRAAASLDYARVARLLGTGDLNPPGDLADALYYINEVATPDGHDLVRAELQRRGVAPTLFDVAPADVAVQAWLVDPQIVQRAHAEVFAALPRRFRYFQSRAEPPSPPLPALTAEALRPMEAYLDNVFVTKQRGRGARVMAYPQRNECLFMVRHGDPRRREGALDGTRETSVLYRPLKFDVVGYDPRWGTLRVYARSQWEVDLYRDAFGLHLFGALDHFAGGTGRYTLEPLRTGDRSCLACGDAAPVKHVNLVEVHLHWGGVYDAVEVHRATDVFAALVQRKAQVPQGPGIRQASFEVWVFGEPHPRRVTIVPPDVARYAREDDHHVIDQWLALRGFIRGRRRASTEAADGPGAQLALSLP